MDQTISTIAMLAGSLSLAIAAIPTLVRQLIELARDSKTRKLEIVIGDQSFVIDVDHLENVPFEQIEAAVQAERERDGRIDMIRRTRQLEAA